MSPFMGQFQEPSQFNEESLALLFTLPTSLYLRVCMEQTCCCPGSSTLEEPRAHCPSWPQQGVILPKPHPNNLFPCHTLSQETCQIMSWPLEREHLIFQIVFQGTSSGRWRKKPRGRCQLWGCRLCRSPRESHMQSHSALKVPQIQGLPK